MPNQKNQDSVKVLQEKVKKAKSITIVDYLGLKSEDLGDFREKMKELNAEPVVTKNTLLKIAMNEEGIDTGKADPQLKGPTAAIFSYNDPISLFKTILDFSKKYELPKIKFSFIERTFTTASQVEVISALPSKEQLLSQVVGGLKSPLSGFVNVLGGTQRKFVTVLSRIAEKGK